MCKRFVIFSTNETQVRCVSKTFFLLERFKGSFAAIDNSDGFLMVQLRAHVRHVITNPLSVSNPDAGRAPAAEAKNK